MEATFYQRLIADQTRDLDPRHVEAWMRLEHPTLDGLSEAKMEAASTTTGTATEEADAA